MAWKEEQTHRLTNKHLAKKLQEGKPTKRTPKQRIECWTFTLQEVVATIKFTEQELSLLLGSKGIKYYHIKATNKHGNSESLSYCKK